MARKSFKNAAKNVIGVSFGDVPHDAHITAHLAAIDAFGAELARTQRENDLASAFSTLPEIADDTTLIDQVASEIEAQELIEEIHAETAPDPVIEIRQPSLADIILSIDETDLDLAQRTINAAIDERSAFEIAKNPNNTNIHRSLRKAREGMGLSKGPARVMLAANVDTAFVNRTLHDGSRYNVYAIDKVVDVLRALSSDTGEIRNAINRACMISLFRLKKAGVPFTSEIAKGCASDKHHVDLAIRKHLMRHTVSAVTAPTQASSTMQAFETLGIVRREGSSRAATYTLTDSPIVRALEARMMKEAA